MLRGAAHRARRACSTRRRCCARSTRRALSRAQPAREPGRPRGAIAANRAGARLLLEMVERYGHDVVRALHGPRAGQRGAPGRATRSRSSPTASTASPTRSTTAHRSAVALRVRGDRHGRSTSRGTGAEVGGQPERAARGHDRGRDLRAARAGRASPSRSTAAACARSTITIPERSLLVAAAPSARSRAATSRPASASSTCCSARSAAARRARAR